MKLLITTQAVDTKDPALGFFHEWITAFAKECESVEVICLYEGEHSLPANVTVHTLGKEKRNRSALAYAFHFFILSYSLRKKYDAVFVHMNPEYLLISGWWWRLAGKRVGLWYLHKSVTSRLRLAVFFTNVIFTASPESFRLKNKNVRDKKLQIVGHGIAVKEFSKKVLLENDASSSDREVVSRGEFISNDKPRALRIFTAGRIAPSKRIIEMLQALDVLYARDIPFSFTIAGGPATPEDVRYGTFVNEQIAAKPYVHQVHMLGPVKHEKIPALLAQTDLFINLSATGSMDKAVLEAFAAGVPVVTSNEAFRDVLKEQGLFLEQQHTEGKSAEVLDAGVVADAIARAREVDPEVFKKYVQENHSLEKLIPRIIALLSK
jgi:glycosyltransferase involved in cell wall biosynthesis